MHGFSGSLLNNNQYQYHGKYEFFLFVAQMGGYLFTNEASQLGGTGIFI